jgi:hypothetical protein
MDIINNEFSIFQQKYYNSTNGLDSKKYTQININNVLWNKYKYFHRDVLNNFLLNVSNETNRPVCEKTYFNSLIATLSHVFTKNEIQSYVSLYLLEDEQTINEFKNVIIDRKVLFNTKLMVGDTTYLLGGTGNEELYCKEYTGLIQSFILDYTNKFNATQKLKQNILKTPDLTLNKYKEMFNHYKKQAFNASKTHTDDNEPIMKINSPLFCEDENTQFIQLNCEHQIECEKVDKILSRANAEYLEVWGRLHKIKYEVVETYTDLHIWEENLNSINITQLVGLIVYYKDNEKVELILNSNRCLCIPFLLIPTNNKHNTLLMDLLHHSTAIPIFRTINIPKSNALANIRNIIKINNLPVVNDIRTIHSNIKEIITDDDIHNIFGDEDDTDIIETKKKRKRSKKKKTNETVKPTIDISTINDNEIVEINSPDEAPDEVEKLYDKDETTDEEEDEDIVLEKIENINNDTIVRFNKIPFNIVFYKYEYISFADKDLITFMINDLYNTNDKFKRFMEQYDTIRIIASFHNDFSAKNNSLHFNGVFYDTVNVVKSSVFHFYIKNNSISSLTTIINIL